jgi:hypothetical protein
MNEQDERSKNATPIEPQIELGAHKRVRECASFEVVHEWLTNEALGKTVTEIARWLTQNDDDWRGVTVESARVMLTRYRDDLPRSAFIRRAWVEARDKLDERFSEVAELQRLCIMQLERLMKLLAFEDEAQFPAAQTGIEADKLARWLKDLLAMRQSLGLTRKEPERVEATVEHRENRRSENMREFLKRTMGWNDEQIDCWLDIPPCLVERSLQMNGGELQSLGASGRNQQSSSSPGDLDALVDSIDSPKKQEPQEASKPAANAYQAAMEKAGVPEDQREYGKRHEPQTVGLFSDSRLRRSRK